MMISHSIGDAAPNAQRAKVLKREMDLRLLDSISYVIGQAMVGMNVDYSNLLAKASVLTSCLGESGETLPGSLYARHTALVGAMRAGAINEVAKLLSTWSFGNCTTQPRIGTIDTPHFSSEEQAIFFDVIGRDYDSTYAGSFDAMPLSPPDVNEIIEIVAVVLSRLAENDPETKGEIDAYVTDVTLIESEHINAGTCFKAFGILYLTRLRPGQTWTTYLENIVHEAAHHHLFAVWTNDSIIEPDGGRLFRSPLRTEPRPMSGIFHAMFVLARTIRILDIFRDICAYERDIARLSTGYNQAKNPATHREKFLDTYETIKRHARLTPVGSEILDTCHEMALSS